MELLLYFNTFGHVLHRCMGGAFLYACMACPLLIPFRPLMILLVEMIADTYNPLTTSSISSHTLIIISMTHE
jgi:hypothetical protein